jgi:PiT family inorganic phosphate transporter
MALAFAVSTGLHDAANATATLVATRVAKPVAAIAVAAVAGLLGPLLFASAVAATVAGIVRVEPSAVIPVFGAGLTGAVAWNLLTWLRGLPSSPSHALVGGLVGAAIADAGASAANWGGMDGIHPHGVVGALVGLTISPIVGFAVTGGLIAAAKRLLRRVSIRARRPVRAGQWASSAVLAFGQGANDAQKAAGALAALLAANGTITGLRAPAWAVAAAAAGLTLGTILGGTSLVRTIGTRITRLRPLGGLAIQTGSAATILVASLVGAPVSATQVVSSSVVGVAVGTGRHRHVRWRMVAHIATAWITTLPAAGLLAAGCLPIWRWIA